jgi:hypothetical protein
MNNKIPRKFNKIVGKMMIDTNMDKAGDIIHVYKNNVSTGYLALNIRTQKHAYIFVSMLRNGHVFEITAIE